MWILPFPLQNLVELDSVVFLSIIWCQVLITCCDWLPEAACASKWHNSAGSCCSVMPECMQECMLFRLLRISKGIMSFCGFMLPRWKRVCPIVPHALWSLWFYIRLLSRIDKDLPADGNITAEGLLVSSSAAVASVAPTPITDTQLHCDCAGGCPPSPLCFLWSPLWWTCSFSVRFICHWRAWKPSLWHPVPLMKNPGLRLQRAHVPSISVIERCCFILLCVPGRQLRLHLQQPRRPVHHLARTFFTHTANLRKAPEPLQSSCSSTCA